MSRKPQLFKPFIEKSAGVTTPNGKCELVCSTCFELACVTDVSLLHFDIGD